MPTLGEGIQKVRNGAFRFISNLLDLPGGIDSLEAVDLDRATPTLDLHSLIRRGLLERRVYHAQTSLTGGGTVDTSNHAWQDATEWIDIWGPGGTFDPAPSDHDLLIPRAWVSCGAHDDVGAIILTRNPTFSILGPIWSGDTVLPAIENWIQGGVGSRTDGLLPFYVDQSMWPEIQVRGEKTSGGGITLNTFLEVLSGPRGIFQPY